MAETLSNLSLVCYIAAAVFLVAAIFLFFALQIPKTFSDYTGRTARKKIMKIRDNNEKTGNKSYRPSQVNKEVKLLEIFQRTHQKLKATFRGRESFLKTRRENMIQMQLKC